MRAATEEPAPSTPVTAQHSRGLQKAPCQQGERPCSTWKFLKGPRDRGEGHFGIGKQEEPQRGKEETATSGSCPLCHTHGVPALGKIQRESGWLNVPVPLNSRGGL